MVLAPTQFLTLWPALLPLIIILIIWELIWKGLALWRAGRHNQLAWFICILLFNTIGILPILYLLFFQKDKAQKTVKRAEKKTR
jgi:hypothetical protein